MNESTDNYQIFEASHDGKNFIIEEELPDIGFCLYIYENGNCTHDYLQYTLDICKSFALEEFGVPLSAWKTVSK